MGDMKGGRRKGGREGINRITEDVLVRMPRLKIMHQNLHSLCLT